MFIFCVYCTHQLYNIEITIYIYICMYVFISINKYFDRSTLGYTLYGSL